MQRKRTLSALAALAAAAVVPLAVAMPASANTSSGCSITPLTPTFAGFNSAGTKLINYRIAVSCTPGRTAEIVQERYEEDGWPNGDDFLGSTTFWRSGVTTVDNVRTLVDTEIGMEEVYQKVRFRVSSNGVTSPWTSFQKSSVLSIYN